MFFYSLFSFDNDWFISYLCENFLKLSEVDYGHNRLHEAGA
jgi:hypothetical protein